MSKSEPYDPVPDLAELLASLQGRGTDLPGLATMRAFDRLRSGLNLAGHPGPEGTEQSLRSALKTRAMWKLLREAFADHERHTASGPENCPACQLLRDNKDWTETS